MSGWFAPVSWSRQLRREPPNALPGLLGDKVECVEKVMGEGMAGFRLAA